jgi:hypothetical protein
MTVPWVKILPPNICCSSFWGRVLLGDRCHSGTLSVPA